VRGVGADPELFLQIGAVEQTEDGLRIAGVDCEQQGARN
jgi:hypothetical protein